MVRVIGYKYNILVKLESNLSDESRERTTHRQHQRTELYSEKADNDRSTNRTASDKYCIIGTAAALDGQQRSDPHRHQPTTEKEQVS